MNKKSSFPAIIIIIILLAGFAISAKEKPADNTADTENSIPPTLTIGAILPLSGPAAIWGENVKKGMDMALADKPELRVLIEDSKGTPADGVSAFHILKGKKADLMLSALSAVSVPVSKVAADEKVPLLATLTAANGIVNEYATRYYSNAQNFAEPSFASTTSPISKAKKIAVLYRNDELGASVMTKIESLTTRSQSASKKEIVFKDSFAPGTTDFSTVILKIKNSGADALIFVPVTPGEAVGILKASKQIGLAIPLVEASNVFADMNTRTQAEGATFYSNSYDFSAPGNAIEFKRKYKQAYGSDPNFAAAFGYDVINLVYACKDRASDIQICIRSVQEYAGVAGSAKQIAPGDFNIPMNFEKVN